MTKLAVDVLILPPDAIMDLAVNINKKFLQKFGGNLILDKNTSLPHLTLAMGIMEVRDLELAPPMIDRLARDFLPIELIISGVETYLQKNRQAIAGLIVDKSERLQKLHEAVIEKFKPLLSYDARSEYFFDVPKTEKLGEYWQSRGPEKNILDKYSPHITLGFGEKTVLKESVNFTANRIAICHLGRYSTCRKILHEVTV